MNTPTPRPVSPAGNPRHQRGSMAIAMMLMLLGLIAMLGLVEVGYLYWAKRDAQKVADMSALSGAQQLQTCSDDNSDNAAARANAKTDNGFKGTLTITCGYWDPSVGNDLHFTAADNDHSRNAVRVQAHMPLVPFFGFAHFSGVNTTAIASNTDPIAVFSIGSQLLRFNGNTPLGGLLKLIGVDLDKTTVLGYDGLAQVKITPGGLLEALHIPIASDIGIGELNELLGANKISLGQLLNAAATVAAQNGVADIDLEALSHALSTKIDLDNHDILPLGSSDEDGGGLFAHITAPDSSTSSALHADVGILDLITTGISIADSGHGVDVQNLNILGLVSVQAGIVEPPSIGIGGVGTKAYNAQVRLYVNIDTNEALGGLLRPLLTLLDTRIHIPLYVDVVNGLGTLKSIDCGSSPPTATISVESSILRACIGKVNPDAVFSTKDVCGDGLQDEELVKVPGSNITSKISINALSDTQDVTVAVGETASTNPNNLSIGDAVENIVEQLLGVISDALGNQANSPSNAASQLATKYLEATKNSNGRYDIDEAISWLSQPPDTPNSNPLQGLGDWTVTKGVPYACGFGLSTCWKDGSVWLGLSKAVKGEGQGLVPGLLGTLLGGLVVNNCSGLISTLLTYNSCVEGNLASYLQTAPEGILGGNIDSDGNCNSLLCIILRPLLDLLKPVLNGVGTLLSGTLANTLGIELGRTDVHLQSLQCHRVQLVY